MSNRRTTSALVETALRGAESAGREVIAADIHGGGFVRVYFTDPAKVGKLNQAGMTCDDIFETRSG